jgi:hypothetical protein
MDIQEKTCFVCGGKHYAKGLCQKHYDAVKYEKNTERILARGAAFRKANPEYAAEWASRNKDKTKAAQKRYREKNPERARALGRATHQRNKEKRNAATREYIKANLEKVRELGRKWHAANLDRHRLSMAKRKAKKLSATPAWANDEWDKFVVSEMYDLAKRRTERTGIVWHVDHIVPLKSDRVCGLHCAANLQVIPGQANHVKGNREWPDM